MSFASDVNRFAEAVRGHRGIENSLHWVMDVTFREDESRIQGPRGGENVSWLRCLAITLLKNETSNKGPDAFGYLLSGRLAKIPWVAAGTVLSSLLAQNLFGEAAARAAV